MEFSFRFRAFRSKAALNRLHRHGFRRRFGTTVPVGRLAGVVGGSYPSALLDEAETPELLQVFLRLTSRTSHRGRMARSETPAGDGPGPTSHHHLYPSSRSHALAKWDDGVMN